MARCAIYPMSPFFLTTALTLLQPGPTTASPADGASDAPGSPSSASTPRPSWDESTPDEPTPDQSTPDQSTPVAPATEHAGSVPRAAPPPPSSSAPSPSSRQVAVPPKLHMRRLKHLKGMISGFTISGLTYLTSVAIGVAFIDGAERIERSDPARPRAFGYRMLIPLVGPFVAIPYARTVPGKVGSGFLGAIQVAGLAGGSIAMGEFIVTNRRIRALRAGVVLSPGGLSLGLRGRF